RMLAAIDSRTRVVALSTVHWTDGTPFDLAPLRKRAADVGALFMLDGTQSIGAVPFDWEALNPDLLVCAGYKWLLGAYQLGFAVIGEALADWQPLEHNWIGREGSEDFTSLTRYRDGFAPGARRFDVGERSNPVSLPMLAESIRQIGQWGVENIAGYTEKLRELLRAELEETFGPCPPEDPPRGPWMYPGHQLSPHLFGVNLPAGQDPVRVAEELRRMKVHVSVRGSSVRVSPHVYNDQGNISALAAALRRACG
ncbi:MAG: aminotransferase class V-fold PLP-dependent enzyme, partial [Deltaproteobacteria bacterium]|nr:aminotransferase class V-fold PLP-dependent enzyme [Deltaproteobacteria bacterium]